MDEMNVKRSDRPIGVLDSGVGGLTVVQSLKELLPEEDLLYFGDSANCPYGNRTKENILELMNNILDFMEERQVKAIAVACNTLSTLYDEYAPARHTPIFSIVQAAANDVARRNLKEVGLVCTEFTANSGLYEKLIDEQCPGLPVYTASNHNLASTLDQGRFEEVPDNVRANMQRLFAKGHPDYVILGCTHYPIVKDEFEKAAPGVTFLNPAHAQAEDIKHWLAENGLLRKGHKGLLEVATSGEILFYREMCLRLGIGEPDRLEQIILK